FLFPASPFPLPASPLPPPPFPPPPYPVPPPARLARLDFHAAEPARDGVDLLPILFPRQDIAAERGESELALDELARDVARRRNHRTSVLQGDERILATAQ